MHSAVRMVVQPHETAPPAAPRVSIPAAAAMSLWWAGALLSMVGSIASNLGVNIQKFSFLREEERVRGHAANDDAPTTTTHGAMATSRAAATTSGAAAATSRPPPRPRPYTRQPLWMLGLALVILGSLGDFAALGLAAQSIVAPIGSITLVSNVLFAHFGLKERLSRRDVLGTVLILVGATLSVGFGNHLETEHTMAELRQLYGRPLFVAYACCITTACIVLYAVIKKLQPLKTRLVQMCQQYELAVLASPRDAVLVAQLDSSIASLERQYEPFERLHPFCYCALSGCLGAQSILFGKMLAEMITASLRGQNQMVYPLTYVFLVCMFLCIFAQLHFLALGLSFFDALLVVPIFQCFFILGSVVGGACYFGEFSEFTLLQVVFFPAGILLTLTGVQILSARKMRRAMPARERAGTADALLLLISDPGAARDETGGDEERARRGGGARSRSSDNLVRAVAMGVGSASGPKPLPAAARHYKVNKGAGPTNLLAPPAPPDSRPTSATADTDRTIDASIHIISGARSDVRVVAELSRLEEMEQDRRAHAANESPVFGPSPLLRENSNDLNMPLCDDTEADADGRDTDDSPPAAHPEPRVKFFLPTGESIETESGAASSRHRRNHSAAGAHDSGASGQIFLPTSSPAEGSCAVFRPPPLERTQSRFARRYSQLLDLTAMVEEEDAADDAAAVAATVGAVPPAPSPLHGSAVATARLHGHSRHPTLDGPSLMALMSAQHEDVDAVLTVAHRRTRSSVAPNGSPTIAGVTVATASPGRKSRRSSLGPAAASLWDAGTAVLGSRPPSPPLMPPQQASLDQMLEQL